jgi:ubiquinone/menaquinone biosynthesis C-methylase UbiE
MRKSAAGSTRRAGFGSERPLWPFELRDVYRKRARWYDQTSLLYGLLGYRLQAYRREGIAALRLRPGCVVVEIGCGTGANFEALREAVGPSGRVIGVDLTDAMLDRARERVRRAGWTNVELVESEASAYAFPAKVDGVLASYSLSLIPGYETVIARAARALRPGRRMVVVDIKPPEWVPQWVLRAFVPLLRPFGVAVGLAERHPWTALGRELWPVSERRHYFGSTYVAVAERPLGVPLPGQGMVA